MVLRQFVARGVNEIRERCALLSQPALESVIASAGWSVAIRNLVAGNGIFWMARLEAKNLPERP